MHGVDRQRLAQLALRQTLHKGRFYNLDRIPGHGLRDFLRWQRESRGRFPGGQRFPVQAPPDDLLNGKAEEPRLTWIGHATFLFRHGDTNLLTDPVFSERVSPVQWAGPKRYTPPALTVDQLPPIHKVLISHNHYDHLDLHSVRALHGRFGEQITWYVPEGVGDWFRKRGIHNLVELGWWQSAPHPQGEAFFVPAQHFSGRTGTDRNRSLWGGWIIDIDGFRLYFAGDTGYGSCFSDIGDVFGGVDLALLPIGAYAPRWFMQPVHVNPDEAVQIHLDVKARRSVAMHWGTFVLTDEPMDEPPIQLRAALETRALDPADFLVLQHGETIAARDTRT
ncbi:beta-lactamase fold Zn-dependent hydrolase [Alcanivorax sp. S71-1-4]|uniref:MBL fold metallo-hydrolase n=1 Tax=Alcanivorax sp. S71-1-4 TaxID=1177159 RepID=UPI00135C9468|nr:MBL fold metallo-hydrolase [Alcanivorax sp. S71-1-4]KAF0810927.1 beta-lactamase fold Zn-dependent hydrolase [Alcanivorax sp. S71-1-4]